MAYTLIVLLKKMQVGFAFAKAIHIFFSAKLPANLVFYLLEQLSFLLLTISLS